MKAMRATRKKRPADQNQWAKAHDAVITRRQPAREVSRPSQARQCFSSYAVGEELELHACYVEPAPNAPYVQNSYIARIRWTAACWRSSATRCVSAAKRAGISLKQTFAKEGKSLCV
jgi:hypothetical protein